MAINKIDFNTIEESDLEELISIGSPESDILEFKSAMYGNSDADKKEMLKDISAFANTHGGHLILGIAETEGVASSLSAACSGDADAEILRIEQIVRSGLEPSIIGIKIRALTLSSGGHAIVVRIPKSWNTPHRVIARNSNRFYMRNSAGTFEPSIEELRILFTQSSTVLEKARSFRDARIVEICSGSGARPLIGNGRLIIHIVPVSVFSGLINLDLEAVCQAHQHFRPLGSSGWSPRFNFHGFVNDRGGETNHGYTQIFRNGCIEATKGSIICSRDAEDVIPGTGIEEYIFTSVPSYISGLSSVGVNGPYMIFVTFEGVRNIRYAVRNQWAEDVQVLSEHLMKFPEGFLENGTSILETHRAMRPTFDALWNAIGYSSSQHFNNEGMWVGNSCEENKINNNQAALKK